MGRLLFKGAKPDTHYWKIAGSWLNAGSNAKPDLVPNPGANTRAGPEAIEQHIIHFSAASPYVSLTHSFAIAFNYARPKPGVTKPGRIFVIDVPEEHAGELVSPVEQLAQHRADATVHDGEPGFLTGLLDQRQRRQSQDLEVSGWRYYANSITPKALRAALFALRDAERLATRIPGPWITRVIEFPEDDGLHAATLTG